MKPDLKSTLVVIFVLLTVCCCCCSLLYFPIYGSPIENITNSIKSNEVCDSVPKEVIKWESCNTHILEFPFTSQLKMRKFTIEDLTLYLFKPANYAAGECRYEYIYLYSGDTLLAKTIADCTYHDYIAYDKNENTIIFSLYNKSPNYSQLNATYKFDLESNKIYSCSVKEETDQLNNIDSLKLDLKNESAKFYNKEGVELFNRKTDQCELATVIN